jgi:hypothetical protein
MVLQVAAQNTNAPQHVISNKYALSCGTTLESLLANLEIAANHEPCVALFVQIVKRNQLYYGPLYFLGTQEHA